MKTVVSFGWPLSSLRSVHSVNLKPLRLYKNTMINYHLEGKPPTSSRRSPSSTEDPVLTVVVVVLFRTGNQEVPTQVTVNLCSQSTLSYLT